MPLASLDFAAFGGSLSASAALYVALAWTAAKRLHAMGRPFGWSVAEGVIATPVVAWLDVVLLSRSRDDRTRLSGWMGLFVVATVGAWVAAVFTPSDVSIELTVPAIVILIAWAMTIAAGSELGRTLAFGFSWGFGGGWTIVAVVDGEPSFFVMAACFLVAGAALIPDPTRAVPRAAGVPSPG